jgi:protein-L-isoaspartate O-methyltransferase
MRVTSYCVGELCAPDVQVLVNLARKSHRVLEFGAGGSTTLWAQFCPPDAEITSVELKPDWHERVRGMLARLGVSRSVRQIGLKDWQDEIPRGAWFDLIFIDHGGDRIATGEEAWPYLMPGGIMAFHDTHWPLGRQVLEFFSRRWLEVGSIQCESAVTACTKCVERIIGATDVFESRKPWESGHAPLPEDWPPARRSKSP